MEPDESMMIIASGEESSALRTRSEESIGIWRLPDGTDGTTRRRRSPDFPSAGVAARVYAAICAGARWIIAIRFERTRIIAECAIVQTSGHSPAQDDLARPVVPLASPDPRSRRYRRIRTE